MTKLQAATDTFKELAFYYVVLMLGSAAIFAWAEGISFGDAVYWAMTTATSTGYGDITPDTATGKIVSLVVMHVSIFFIAPLIIVRLFDKVVHDRDHFSHEEQEEMKANQAAIMAALGIDKETRDG